MTLPQTVDLLAFDWMRAQFVQWLVGSGIAPNALTFSHRISPAPFVAMERDAHPTIAEAHRALWGSMRLHGYHPERVQLEPYHTEFGLVHGGGPIAVGLDASGSPYILDGTHRLLGLLFLGKPLIAEVVERDPRWLEFVESAHAINGNGFLYQQLPHPDFAGWGHQRTESQARQVWPVLEPLGIRSMVDIGCCSGAFAVDLSPVIPTVLGIDTDDRYLRLARWLAGQYGCEGRAAFVHQSAMDPTPPADLVCLLSVLHHMIHSHGLDLTLGRLRKFQSESKYLLTEIPIETEPHIADNESIRSFICSEVAMMQSCGWSLMHDFGADIGFAGGTRRIRLWASGAA